MENKKSPNAITYLTIPYSFENSFLKKRHYEILVNLVYGIFMLLSCNNKSSQSAAIATDEPEVNEDTLFRVIDLANNLKPCGDSLLLSDIVEDVEYVKLEAAEKGLVGAMNRGYVSDSAIFIPALAIRHLLLISLCSTVSRVSSSVQSVNQDKDPEKCIGLLVL